MSEYGMFSKEGNDAVEYIVQYAKENSLNWIETSKLLWKLSKKYSEAMDTDVRDEVYHAIGATESFWS